MNLETNALSKTYFGRRAPVVALSPTTFRVEGGEIVALLGPSGCGKSTVLNLVAGLEEATSGDVLVDGVRVGGPGPERGMVFQGYTLFPWLTVIENTCFSSRLSRNRARPGRSAAEDAERARSLLELMGLSDFRDAYPRELSGGMQQRVAIARALANRPKVLLMDEPFGALDAQTREELQELMLLLHAHEGGTVLFVTHDVEEAMYLSARVLVFSPRPGRILGDVPVPFGPSGKRRPELKLTTEFIELKRALCRMLRAVPSQEGREASIERLGIPTRRGSSRQESTP